MCALGVVVAPVSSNLTWDMTAAQIGRHAGYGDPHSFITGALDVARHGWVTVPNYWLVRLWPPGFMLLEGAVIRVLGEDAPLLVVLLVLSALCCAAWLTLLRQYLLPLVPRVVANVAPLLPFAFPLTSFFMLGPLGLAFGETFAISLFLSAFLLVLLACRNGSYWQAAVAGVALALSAYFRSQFEVLVVFLTLGAVVLAGAAWLLRRRNPAAVRAAWMALVAVAVAQVLMAPWRIHNYLESTKLVWVHTSDLVARNALTPEATLLSLGANFVVRGGGHLACKLEPSYCGRDDPRLFYSAFFRHPGAWLAEKANLLPEYWLAPPSPRSVSSVLVGPTPWEAAVNVLLLGLLLASWWRLWRARGDAQFPAQAWFQLSFYGCLAAIYTMAQFEARYFYLPKIFGIVALLTLLPRPAAVPPMNNVVNR